MGRWEEHSRSSHFLFELFFAIVGEASSFCSIVRRVGPNRKSVLEDTSSFGDRPPSTRSPQKAKRSPQAATFSKVQPAAPKSKVSSIQAAVSALGQNPDPAVLASLQEVLQGRRESSPSTHVQADPGKSPDARVAEAQASVSRLQAELDLLGAEGISRNCQEAMSRAACRRTSGFLFEVRARTRTHRTTGKLSKKLVRISVGCRVTRFRTITSRNPTHRAFDRNHRVAGFATRS